MLKIVLLGNLYISGPHGEASFSRRQLLAVLAVLAVSRSAVTRDRLAFLLWSDTPQSIARQRLRRVLSQLGQILEKIGAANILIITTESVALDESRCKVDVWEFVRLAHLACQTRGTTSVTLSEKCLALYRGPLLDNLILGNAPEFENWLTLQRNDLSSLYEEILFTLANTYSHNGNVNQAILTACKLLPIDPLNEATHRLLMSLYAIKGQRSAALKQYEECARLLHSELGIEPLPETTALYESLQRGKRSCVFSDPPIWATYSCLDAPYWGRDTETNQLQQALTAGLAGNPTMACIHGPAGIGKTRLIREVVERFSVDVFLVGGGSNQAKSVPFSTILSAIRSFLTRTASMPHSDYPFSHLNISDLWLSEVSYILPEIRLYYPNLCPPEKPESDERRSRLFEALTQLVIALAKANCGAVLVLDALDEADPCTLAWLSNLVRRLHQVPLGIAVAYRTPINNATLREWVTYMDDHPIQRSIALSPLPQESIVELLGCMDISSYSRAHLAKYCWDQAGGNPLFILETLHTLLQTQPFLPITHKPSIPGVVQQSIQSRISTLNQKTQAVLEACAILNPNLCLDLIQDVSGCVDLEIAGALDELMDCGILFSEKGWISFTCGYIAEVAYALIGPMRQAVLSQRAHQSLQTYAPRDLNRIEYSSG